MFWGGKENATGGEMDETVRSRLQQGAEPGAFYFISLLTVLGLHCRADFSLVAASEGCSPGAARGLLTVVGLLLGSTGLGSVLAVAVRRLWRAGSGAQAQ